MLQKADLEQLLGPDSDSDKPLIVLMCGIAGSGKTTFSQKIEPYGFTRLSIDEEVWAVLGRNGISISGCAEDMLELYSQYY